MGRHRKYKDFTKAQKKYILDNYLIKSVPEMMKELKQGFCDRRIHDFLNERGLMSLDIKPKKKKETPQGMFDPSERKCWFVGRK
jgi:hypothetical protein